MSNSDQQLMLQVADGDLEAYGELVRRHQQTAWRVAYRLLGDPAEAEDAAQQAFLKIFEAASRYRPTAAFSTYLYRVVTRHCLDRMEKKKPLYVDELPPCKDDRQGPRALLESRQRRRQIRESIEELPRRQRTAIVLFHFEGLSYDEIAESMECSRKAVERLLARGRSRLASVLTPLSPREQIG